MNPQTPAIHSSAVYRRNAIICGSIAVGTLVPVAFFQVGWIHRLPDPPLPMFNSGRIVMSKHAHPLGIPDGFLGLASYSVTLALLISAGPGHPLLGGMLRAKLFLDKTIAVRKARSQRKRFGQLCSWCLLTAAATVCTAQFARKARQAERHNRR
jgi:uncharacterized membrane protein